MRVSSFQGCSKRSSTGVPGSPLQADASGLVEVGGNESIPQGKEEGGRKERVFGSDEIIQSWN